VPRAAFDRTRPDRSSSSDQLPHNAVYERTKQCSGWHRFGNNVRVCVRYRLALQPDLFLQFHAANEESTKKRRIASPSTTSRRDAFLPQHRVVSPAPCLCAAATAHSMRSTCTCSRRRCERVGDDDGEPSKLVSRVTRSAAILHQKSFGGEATGQTDNLLGHYCGGTVFRLAFRDCWFSATEFWGKIFRHPESGHGKNNFRKNGKVVTGL
jgi:hypothetical protein